MVAARYATALMDWNGEVTPEFRHKLRTLQGLCQDVVQLRRGDLNNARLTFEHEQLEWQRAEAEKLSQIKVN